MASLTVIISLVIFIAIIVSVDVLFLRNDFKKRLIFNVAVFLIYLTVFLTFLS